jgi:threonine aldolase
LLGKEAAMFVPTGTMANQVALRVLTRPGDDVIVSRESHAVWHETGAGAANAGVQFTDIGARGTFTADDVVAALKPRGHALYPPTTLVEIENTHNRSGGIVFPQHEIDRICAAARERKIATFLDGARLWNAAIASSRSLADLAAPFDLVSVALSKGLGAPAGSVLAASRDVIGSAIRHRRMLGGAMRQAGILAAAGLYALDHNLERLADDHANARRIGERLAQCPHIDIDIATVQTNILVFRLGPDAPDAASVVNQARERGVLIFAFAPRTIRAVTHLDVSAEQCTRAAEILVAIAERRAG